MMGKCSSVLAISVSGLSCTVTRADKLIGWAISGLLNIHWYWYCSAQTYLISNVLNDALQIVTECRRPTPTDQPSIISGIHSAELRHIEAVPSLTSLGTLDADRMLYSLLSGSFYSLPESLRSKRPFVQLRGIYGTNFQWTSKASAVSMDKL